MADYRLYLMNIRSGHIDSARDLSASGDSEAIREASGLARRGPMELWCAGRKVHRFEAPDGGFASLPACVAEPVRAGGRAEA